MFGMAIDFSSVFRFKVAFRKLETQIMYGISLLCGVTIQHKRINAFDNTTCLYVQIKVRSYWEFVKMSVLQGRR